MALKNPYKLEKLTIEAYQDEQRKTQVVEFFNVMFNPESYSQKFAIEYVSEQPAKYARSAPSILSFKLVIDGTGSHELKPVAGQSVNEKTVEKQIKHLLDISYYMNGNIHEPNYLIVKWGSLSFSCRMSSIDINYTSFNPDGTALRAELTIELLSDQAINKQLALESKSSPDLTHSRLVKDGDTLPLLSKEIYGSSNHYLWIAQQNQLDDFRNLTAGQRLFFPPLVS
jgi:nucleoid-associated protein YgaU